MTKTYETIRREAYRFSSISLAKSFAYSQPKLLVVMGECPEYLVVTPANASRLDRLGFEIVR